MKRETVRCVKLAAADGANGINAKIAAVSLDVAAGDVRPVAVTLYNDIDHEWVARRELNAEDADVTYPAFAIFQFAPLEVIDAEVHTIVRDAYLQVALALLVKNVSALSAISDGEYVNRAVLQFLHWFARNDQSGAFRTRNGIVVRSIEKITQDDVHEDWKGALCVAQTIVTFRVRETQP